MDWMSYSFAVVLLVGDHEEGEDFVHVDRRQGLLVDLQTEFGGGEGVCDEGWWKGRQGWLDWGQWRRCREADAEVFGFLGVIERGSGILELSSVER